jgi:hypothetical protein
VDWDWGNGPAEWPDHFSTRFERTINFNPGTYRFVARADDGVRVFIDNQPIIDQWHISSGNVEYTAVDLNGNPTLTRREPRSSYPLDVNWGNGSPAPGIINDDNFSSRWVGNFYFDQGNYQFQTNTDDGVRVYIDGLRVIRQPSDYH